MTLLILIAGVCAALIIAVLIAIFQTLDDIFRELVDIERVLRKKKGGAE